MERPIRLFLKAIENLGTVDNGDKFFSYTTMEQYKETPIDNEIFELISLHRGIELDLNGTPTIAYEHDIISGEFEGENISGKLGYRDDLFFLDIDIDGGFYILIEDLKNINSIKNNYK